MKTSEDILKELQKPFPAEEVEWRAQSCGLSNNGKPWVIVLAYIQARAIQKRLDEIFGWDNWFEEYRQLGNDVICRLTVRIEGKEIFKENGASNTDIEAFKGGISGAFKRVASSGYGIGRYLYNLEESFTECQLGKPANMDGWGKAKTKDKKTTIYWKIPKLPTWALPDGYKYPNKKPTPSTDNTNKNDKPGFKCAECGEPIDQSVKTYSEKYFGKALCRNCQKKNTKIA